MISIFFFYKFVTFPLFIGFLYLSLFLCISPPPAASSSDMSMVTGLSLMFESFAAIVLSRMTLCCSSGVIRLNFHLYYVTCCFSLNWRERVDDTLKPVLKLLSNIILYILVYIPCVAC